MKKGTVPHIAKLANIPITDEEVVSLSAAFDKTLETINTLQQLDTSQVKPTHQVTKLVNIFREDEVDEKRMFTQAEALKNAQKVHNHFFVVDQLINQED